MSPAARLATVVAGLAAIVIAFFVLQPADDEDDAAPVGAQPAATTAQPSSGTTGTTAAATTPAPAPEPEVPSIRIREGEPVGGVQEIEVDKGDTVRIRVSTDAATELHLHGYDEYLDVAPGRSSVLRFDAKLDGRFELEDHNSGKLLAQVSVFP
jgi:FtsP/CotA-like multicopper oxidase with cupredoxin domain